MQLAVQHASEEVFALSKRRIKFTKLNMAKFISHLDLLRAFTRAIKRADLPVVYSCGFNPHQKITFSLPLSVGVTSECEYVDIDFEDVVNNEEIKEKMNEALPPDMQVLCVSEPVINANDICAAEYKIKFYDAEFNEDILNSFINEEFLPVVKKTKKGEKEVNLKDYIKDFIICDLNEEFTEIKIILSAGGSENIKPSLFTEKLLSYASCGENAKVYIHRTQIFYMDKDNFKNFC